MLPFVDEHLVEVAASPEVTWQALLHEWERPLPGWFSRLLGCQDTRPAGPLVGFHVEHMFEFRPLSA